MDDKESLSSMSKSSIGESLEADCHNKWSSNTPFVKLSYITQSWTQKEKYISDENKSSCKKKACFEESVENDHPLKRQKRSEKYSIQGISFVYIS